MDVQHAVAIVKDVKPKGGSGLKQLWVERRGVSLPALNGTLLYMHDVVKTGKSTIALIEFLIGGRVGINADTAVQIVTERSVADFGALPFKRAVGKTWALWTSEPRNLRRPLEIQTNGGVLGHRG